MMSLTLSVLNMVIKSAFVPALLIGIQVKLSRQKKGRWGFAFIGLIIAILVVNYIFLINTAPLSEMKQLSLDLQDGNRAEMYVRENGENEIIVFSPMKIINGNGVVIDEAESPVETCYEPIISKMTGDRSLINSVGEDEETIANPKNMIFEYEGGIYEISIEMLLKHSITLILALVLTWGISRFLYNRKKL